LKQRLNMRTPGGGISASHEREVRADRRRRLTGERGRGMGESLVTRRLAIVQHGDYAEALRLIRDGEPEPYFVYFPFSKFLFRI